MPKLPPARLPDKVSRTVLSRRLADGLPNQVDVHVGNRLRIRRMLKGMTQDELATSVGITFQQVQKYEKGANRISASRLYAFASVLTVRVGYFFDELDENLVEKPHDVNPDVPPVDGEFLGSREALELIGAYWRIGTPAKRDALLRLIREVSS